MRYWAFHCNPKAWNSVAEIKEHEEGTWLINKQDKDDIRIGDKFILWISGKNAGIYAFGEVVDGPKLLPEDEQRAKLYAIDQAKFDSESLRVRLHYVDKLIDSPIPRSVILLSHWLPENSLPYSFFNRPQGITSRELPSGVYDRLLDLKDYRHAINDFKEFLITAHKSRGTSEEYLKMMPKIERWFIKNGVCNADFTIWGSKAQVSVIDHKLGTEFSQKWKALNKEENNWYSSPWNKWVEFNSNPNKKYWLYSPGRNASEWDDFHSLGIMGLGWDKLGDLNNYADKSEIVKKLQELDNSTGSKKNDATANYEFRNVISIGDIIIVKKGNSELLGYGVVTSDYYYDTSRDSFQKCREVEWKKKGNWTAGHTLAQKTLTDITRYKSDHSQYQFYYQQLLGTMGIDSSTTINTPARQERIDLPLNTILYGPPGTGKTHKSKNEYFKLFTDEQSTQTREEHCQELVKDLAWWEVISVVMLDRKNSNVQRIFEHPLLQAKNSISVNKTPKNTIWAWLQRHTKEDCPHVKLRKRDLPQFFWKDDKGNWTIDEEIAKTETPDFYEVLENYRNYTPVSKTEKRYVFTTFHQSFSYEDFIEGIKPKLTKPEEQSESADVQYHIEKGIFKGIVEKAKANKEKNFAIFIDEINRGNIANIFGELITLIEDDKRIGRDNHIPATLPYSKEEFGVPENLYIIGTMNTADRSVEALDTALRRRFSFIEMLPEPEKLAEPEFACEGIELDKLLFAINSRIEKLLDKNYCIGHSYFMAIKDRQSPLEELKHIFQNKILPLLQEYFYGDWGKIMLVLGKGLVRKKESPVKFLAIEDYEEYEEFDSKPIYCFTDYNNWTLGTFAAIYE